MNFLSITIVISAFTIHPLVSWLVDILAIFLEVPLSVHEHKRQAIKDLNKFPLEAKPIEDKIFSLFKRHDMLATIPLKETCRYFFNRTRANKTA